ncbi:MAG: hypothetical protein A2231_02215 [Candidatus Firestonebacteria bacterium RIFOXYA2_FULL_40_8]|nr:MAG: hypothetical protein A2231_02215 [Candidatus Firestonebacteria bacterium RIFOXYA2_FULL_40_8]
MFIAAQYFRPPFPHQRFFEEDLKLMKKTGLTALQLWVMWGWVEGVPGKYNFDDYDKLFELAKKNGLKVVLSTIAEIHPFWIHRVIPDSHMVTNMGNKVISSCREESNVGLTPGGCTDNPKVLERMGGFLEAAAKRYSGNKDLIGWDCWNELRWNVFSDGYVCYCPHTLKAFRDWLSAEHGGLKGINEAWKRRYASLEDVLPGKTFGRTYTEMMEFQRFLTKRAAVHMAFRYEKIRKYDKTRIISAHGAGPSINTGGGKNEQALSRGNDFELADKLDGIGCSHFPFWGEGFDFHGFGVRVEAVRSAARDKVMWVSELQGGSARGGIEVHRSVTPEVQNNWVWNGFSRGAKGIIFWCWRDEVFARESSGFGLAGNDGLAKERLEALSVSCEKMNEHEKLFNGYMPDPAKVGVFFEPDTYYMKWAEKGNSIDPIKSIEGYARALEKLNIPYDIVESSHLKYLKDLKVLFMPWPLIVNEDAKKELLSFVKNGGTIITESELDAYTGLGFYNYTGDRTLAAAFGLSDKGRRELNSKNRAFKIGKNKLKSDTWVTPLHLEGGKVLAKDTAGNVLAAEKKFGLGKIIALSTFCGKAYAEAPYTDFENFTASASKNAGVESFFELKREKDANVQWRSGVSGGERLLFLINNGKATKITASWQDKKQMISLSAWSWNVYIIEKDVLKKL